MDQSIRTKIINDGKKCRVYFNSQIADTQMVEHSDFEKQHIFAAESFLNKYLSKENYELTSSFLDGDKNEAVHIFKILTPTEFLLVKSPDWTEEEIENGNN